MRPNIITISGPSAVGKSFFIERILSKFPNIKEIVGLTTRPKRDGEIEGKSGHFMTIEEMEQLEKNGELMLVKEFFGNKYAWYKRDLVNTQDLKIINISYKSVEELKKNGLNIFSIFMRPESEESLKAMLKLRTTSELEYKNRLKDYYESEQFIKESKQKFDLIFTNHYDEASLEEMTAFIEKIFILNDKNNSSLEIDKKLKSLLLEDMKLDYKIHQLTKKVLDEYQQNNKREKEHEK